MMTRNDFEILARHLKAMNPGTAFCPEDSDDDAENSYRDGYRAAINQVMGACSAVNARFDRDRFLKACGVST